MPASSIQSIRFNFPQTPSSPAGPHPRLPFPPVETLVPCSLCGPIEGRVRPLVAGFPHHHVFIVSISPPEAVTPIFCSFSASRESATWPLVPLSNDSLRFLILSDKNLRISFASFRISDRSGVEGDICE